jgi:hypothetical protein
MCAAIAQSGGVVLTGAAGVGKSRLGPRSPGADVLAVSDPVELPVLHGLADEAGVDAAAARGLVTVDPAAGMVHLAHPLFGAGLRVSAQGSGIVTAVFRCGPEHLTSGA